MLAKNAMQRKFATSRAHCAGMRAKVANSQGQVSAGQFTSGLIAIIADSSIQQRPVAKKV